jgi:hypothetical protein
VEHLIVINQPNITNQLTRAAIVGIAPIIIVAVAMTVDTGGRTIGKKISYNLNEEA